ncbi:MAG: ribosome maturation factor RimP [Clostridia bacterium]|nr:ribosome maturation factor RimP [Clostridia bacterium]
MAERVVDKALKIIKPIVEDLGYVFVDLEYKKEFSGYVLALTIDKPEGVNINDCERVSRALDEPLDVADVTNGAPYNFNVSSYGLDRQFKTDYDFNKHIGQVVDIKFYAPMNGCKEWTGTLLAFDDKTISVEYNKNNQTIERKLIASICAHIEF